MGKYLEKENDAQVQKLNMKLNEAKEKAKDNMVGGGFLGDKYIDTQRSALASYFTALEAEEILNQYGEDIVKSSQNNLVNDSSILHRSNNIKDSAAFQDITKNLTSEEIDNIREDEKKIKDLYNTYKQSSLEKAAEPKYTLVTPEEKAKREADKKAKEEQELKQKPEREKAAKEKADKEAKEKAAADKKAAEAEKKRKKEEEKQRKAQEKQRKKEEAAKKKAEAKRKKEEEKQRKAQEKQKKKEEAAKKKAEEAKKKAEAKQKKEEEKKKAAEEKKKQKEASAKKSADAKKKPAEETKKFDAKAAIESAYKDRQKELVYNPDTSIEYNDKSKIAFALQTEISKNEALADIGKYKSQADITNKLSSGAVNRDAKKLASDKQFNDFYESLGEDAISDVMVGSIKTDELYSKFESFKKLQAEKAAEPEPEVQARSSSVAEPAPTADELAHNKDIEHYKGEIEAGIAQQRQKVSDTLKNTNMTAEAKTARLEKSLAAIITYNSMDAYLDKEGANMTKDDMRALCNKTNAENFRNELMKKEEFKTFCSKMGPEDYQAVADNKVAENSSRYKDMFKEAQKESDAMVYQKTNAAAAPVKQNQGAAISL